MNIGKKPAPIHNGLPCLRNSAVTCNCQIVGLDITHDNFCNHAGRRTSDFGAYICMEWPPAPMTAAPRKKPCALCGPLHHTQRFSIKTLHKIRADTGDVMHVLLSVHASCAAGKRVTVAQVFVFHVKCCNGWKCHICHKHLSRCML